MAWNRVEVKLTVMTAEAANGVVVRWLLYCGMKWTVHIAVGGVGASVPILRMQEVPVWGLGLGDYR